ncbi:hypothetical protein H6790_02445 [Candidatus Nomurabacteria bacterium]|nr:hypothetical protein [Candidatus Nomurabacteria bacterium]MCB9820783.1 hypothetical protein [Candidatus Nomurabacteria bacterium]
MHKVSIKMIGWFGTILLIGTYALNSFGFLHSQSILYPVLNLLAAIALGARVYADKNYSNLILEIFWGGIAVFAIIKFVLSST